MKEVLRESHSLFLFSRSTRQTINLGRALGSLLKKGDVVCLIGDLGSGKTCLVKGIAMGLEVESSHGVRSPTFTIIHEHPGPIPLYHFDLYRLEGPGEVSDLGYEEYFYGKGITVIEWAEKVLSFVPEEHLEVELRHYREKEREIKVTAFGARFQALLRELLKKPFIRKMSRPCQEE